MSYVNLHAHTIYSSLDGHALVRAYLEKAKTLGHTHAAITDHGTMAGVPEFVKTAAELGITPIIGMEAYVEPDGRDLKDPEHKHNFHLTLLCQNQTGYHNLMALATESSVTGYYSRPRIDHSLLERHHEGLIVLSGCGSGELGAPFADETIAFEEALENAKQVIDFHQSLFGERYFLEVQEHGEDFPEQRQINRAVMELARKSGLKIAATNDSHFCAQEEHALHKLLVSVNRGARKLDEKDLPSRWTYLRSDHEMACCFDAAHLTTTLEIASMIEPVSLGSRVPKLPISPLERPGERPTLTLIALARAGLERRLGVSWLEVPEAYRDRLASEIAVIERLSEELGADFGRYLLMIADICAFARREAIRFGPRGSAAGSLICWALGISEPDPIKDGLYFERFLNPFRVELPDVDLDFADDRREEVFGYLKQTYGVENVAKIGTYAVLGAKQAIKDVASSLREEFTGSATSYRLASEELIGLIPDDPRPGGIPLAELLADPEGRGKPILERTGRADPESQLLQKVLMGAVGIEGRLRGQGMHAAGVVVSSEPLSQIVPLMQTKQAQKDDPGAIAVQTQYEMSHLEALGLLKVDVLGLKTLTVLDETLGLINAEADPIFGALDPWAIPWDDEPTWELIRSGKTLSLFQIGSEGLGAACHQFQPASIEDLAITVAVYRPGPMGNFTELVARKEGRSSIESLHPALDHILQKTYGFPIYQEQVMEIARAFAGYSLGEADLLRKAMGKKIREKMAAEKIKFLAGSAQLGHSVDEAEHIWSFLVPFADYGFNRAHAICYAYVAYQTAYLKTHFPQKFYSAALSIEATTGGEATPQQRIGNLIREAKSLGIRVAPPQVNHPQVWFRPEGEQIRYGLAAIKDVGVKEAEAIVAARRDGPFTGIADFVMRCPQVRRGALETLANVGAANFGHSRRSLTEVRLVIGPRGGRKETSKLGELVELRTKRKKKGQLALELGVAEDDAAYGIEALPEHPTAQLLLLEQQHLGYFTTPMPEAYGCVTIKEIRDDALAARKLEGQAIKLQGVVTQFTQHVTRKSNKLMGYVQLLDETDSGFNGVIFPKTYEMLVAQSKLELLREGTLIFVVGQIKTDRVGDTRLFIDNLWQPDLPEELVQSTSLPKALSRRFVFANFDLETLDQVAELYELAERYPGEERIEIVIGGAVDVLGVSEAGLTQLALRQSA